jgi:hypothetical protein
VFSIKVEKLFDDLRVGTEENKQPTFSVSYNQLIEKTEKLVS